MSPTLTVVTTPSQRFADGWASSPVPSERSAGNGRTTTSGGNGLLARTRATPLGARSGHSVSYAQITKGADSLSELLVGQLNLSGAEALSQPYEESKWVHACIRALSTSMLQAPLKFYIGDPLTAQDDDQAAELPVNHELYKLFSMPSTHQTGLQFREANLVHRKLDGETIWFLMDVAGEPVDVSERSGKIKFPHTIVPVRGKAVEIRPNERGLPGEYIYPSKARKEFPPHSVVHFRDYDPSNPLRGLGDVEVLLRDLAAEFQAQRYQEGLLGNGGNPGGWILNKGSMSDPKRRGEEAAINDRYGNVENAGAWHVMSGKDVQVVPNDMKPKDMEYMALRQYTFNAVCAILGVPTILLGDTASATFSNFEQAMRQLWTGPNGIISYLRSEEDTMKAFFLNRLETSDAERIYARHDLGVVPELQEDSGEAIEKAGALAARGIGISFNDAAAVVGLNTDPVDGGDLQLIDGKYRPIEELNDQPEDSPVDSGKESKSIDPVSLDEMLDAVDDIKLDRAAYVQRVVDVVAPSEKRLALAMRKYLRKYELAQVKRVENFAKTGKELFATIPRIEGRRKGFDVADLTANDLARLLLDPEEWADKLYTSSAPMIEASFEASLASIESEIGITGLTMEDASVINALERQGVKLANGVGGVDGTLSRKVEKALLRVFEESSGTTVNSLQEAVRELLPQLKGSLKKAFTDRDSRALTIAQTESAKSANTARYMSMKKSDVVEKHEWVTAQDGEVRKSHSDQNGDVVVIGEQFENGLRYPLDPNGPADEVIGCRCAAAPVIEDRP